MTLKDKYINPLTDFGFKKLFGSEPNKDLLIDFLNQVLPEKHQIKDLSYASNEHLGSSEIDRKAIFDLYCISTSGERFIVELQKAKQDWFKDRSIYYSSFPIQEQAKSGEWNYKLEPVYTVGILDFVFNDHKDEEEYFHIVALKNQKCEVFYDKLKFIYIELPKFTKTEDELETQFEKWLYVFRYLSKLNSRPKKLQERVFKKVFEAAEIAKYTPKEQLAYESSLKYYRDMINVIDSAKNEGQEEGFEKGYEKGIEQGIEKGRLEGLQKLKEVAKNLKKIGVSVEQIVLSTGLTKEEIDEL